MIVLQCSINQANFDLISQVCLISATLSSLLKGRIYTVHIFPKRGFDKAVPIFPAKATL
jgi:hypothetical protein